LIEIDNLKKSFGSRVVWSNVNLTISRGDMLALIGPSGAGKSTLLNCLGLLETPSSGAIRYEGKDIGRFGSGKVRRFRRDVLGYLFQNYALIENATIAENLEIAVKPRRSSRNGNTRVSIPDALERVGLAGRGKENIYHLSGGEQQRVALARLLVKQPSLVLADEPTGALDHTNTIMVVDTLQELSGAGSAVVIATHNDYVRQRCEKVFSVGDPATAINDQRKPSASGSST
jgi:putative ABC transport system ATP-binding protein